MLFSRFKIVGHSMSPNFAENDNVIVSSLPFIFLKPKIGDIVVFNNYGKLFIKRIKKIKEEKYFLVGDNSKDSHDSRKFGFVERQQIKGKVIIKI